MNQMTQMSRKHPSHDVRSLTRALLLERAGADAAGAEKSATLAALINTWLMSLDEDDLAGIAPEQLAPLLWDGFTRLALRPSGACQIAQLRYQYGLGAGNQAMALLILNQDMPYLVDSIVMALRQQHCGVRGVMNSVLAVRRAPDGSVAQFGQAGDPLESWVLCLLAEDVAPPELAPLLSQIDMVTRDAAVVQRDFGALEARVASIAASAMAQVSVRNEEGLEVAAFLEWAKSGGFEFFGYGYYRVKPGARELERDGASRIGVLADSRHPLYGNCLANIPGDFDSLAARADILSIVKADVASALHREQQLDFIGVRDTDANGVILGEHCFVGLFTRIATLTPLARLPYARGRVAKVLSLAGVRQEGFRAEKFGDILESLPRTEALEADPAWLAQVCGAVVSLYKQPRTRVFARRDVYARHLNVLVYLPRERYSASLAGALAQALRHSSGATHVSLQTLVADGPLARLYLIAHAARYRLDLEADIQEPLLSVLDGWRSAFERLLDGVLESGLRASLRQLANSLPPDYEAATAPETALDDMKALLGNTDPGRIAVRIDTRGGVTIRLYSIGRVPALSAILPALHNAGVAIEREQNHAIVCLDEQRQDRRQFVTSLRVDASSAAKLAQPQVAVAAQALFTALFNDEAEDGRMNGLVIEGALSTREVQLVRAYVVYWRQSGSLFSVRYIADCLRKHGALVKALVKAFLQRFDPQQSDLAHAAALSTLDTLKLAVEAINHLDTEEIFGALLELVRATVRTNYFQHGQQGDKLIFKFDAASLALLPEPRPWREIFIFSRRFEGVHLRGGPVARGGLRWSDRMEDYRTEIMGLLKAQMVKNAVIVPVGAKGGFVCKMTPKVSADDAAEPLQQPARQREATAAEGQAVYRLFIASLLEVSDNRVQGKVVAPPDTVCYDDPDPYLVVAADKGTASFSDIANEIALARGFWLGDAFASGGSNGYDHKKLGITAKGAWQSVRRHFYEMAIDPDTTPITLVGVGDMSGDVFGNGVLLSRHLKLIAAFDHRHIFLDPAPDPGVAFDERARLFALPRSSWDEYDKRLISSGGGVYPRTARRIELSPQMRAALGLEPGLEHGVIGAVKDSHEAATLTPDQLMHAILRAPVDLFYNGGIGTYIKASHEIQAQARDRANDAIRVDANRVRAKIVVEGGNLGVTQAGRIEFALAGGRIFSDAIDNSAGVDCSDHEVNVKIWLDAEVDAGQLAPLERQRLLNQLTPDIERLVLRDNALQTGLLAREAQAQHDGATQDAYALLIAGLDEEGALARDQEQLPTVAELARRSASGRGLVAPELALLVAIVKNRYKTMLSTLPLLEQHWAGPLLTPYFPADLVAGRSALAHPLANAILATVLANEVVNRCGPLLVRAVASDSGVAETQVILAWARGWSALNLAPLFDIFDGAALTLPLAQSGMRDARARLLQKTIIEGVLSVAPEQGGSVDGFDQLASLFGQPDRLRQLLPVFAGTHLDAEAGVEPDVYLDVSPGAGLEHAWQALEALEQVASFVFAALGIARPAGMNLASLLQAGLALRSRAGIDALERGLNLAPSNQAQARMRNYARKALQRASGHLLARVLGLVAGGAGMVQAVDAVAHTLGAFPPAAELEQAMLNVWAWTEACLAMYPGQQGGAVSPVLGAAA